MKTAVLILLSSVPAFANTDTSGVNWPRASLPAPVTAAANLAIDGVALESQSSGPKRFKVLVDIGHGGHDFGAAGHHGVLEKEVCLRIGRQVRLRLLRLAKLYDFPMEVRLTREQDSFLGLRKRVEVANDWQADLFVSVHANSSPAKRARGFEVYFLSNEATDADASRVAQQENGENLEKPISKGILSILSDLRTNNHILESSRFAESVYAALAERLRPNGRGVRQAPFTVLHGTQMPALLIEVGYLTNPEDAESLVKAAHQQKVATGISEGVLGFALRMRRLGKSLPIAVGNRST